jgi:hypothetical protein
MPDPTPLREIRSPEVRLLGMLCRYPADRIDAADACRVCSEVLDWNHFLRLAAHHRVMPLIANNAAKQAQSFQIPPAVTAELRARASANALEAFRSLAETRRLLSPLASAGVAATVIKGVPLSLQAFGDVATRDVGDIDLLIRPEEAEAADAVLQSHGFVRQEPAGKLTPRRRASYAAHFKDYTYEPKDMQSEGGFEVDLHWRFFRTPKMPGNTLGHGERTPVSAGAQKFTTLAPEIHLLYLSVQGALDGWTRFKAVADVAALWNGLSDRADLLSVARESGVLPYLHAALNLADRWIGGIDSAAIASAVPLPKMSREIALSQRIVARAQQKMERSAFLPEPRETSSFAMKRYEASLSDAHGYKWAIARRIFFRPRVWSRFDLPDPLFSLYPLLSPIEWLLFHLHRSRGKFS